MQLGVGGASGREICPLGRLGMSYEDMNDLIERADAADWSRLRALAAGTEESDAWIPFSEVILCAPIPEPRQDILCLGINYMAHAVESARFKEEAFGGDRTYPVYFSKRVSAAVPDGGVIEAHEDICDSLDYEAELAVILGKDVKDAQEEDVYDCILGYTVINDVTARNLQTRHKQWYFGKSLDGFTPMGPCIVTKEELPWPVEADVKSYVNGELRQEGNTRDLIHGITHVICEWSRGATLKAGTIIATGTPAGAGMGFVPPKFLRKGDRVVCEVEGVGRISNVVG